MNKKAILLFVVMAICPVFMAVPIITKLIAIKFIDNIYK